jgi:hypothetical protein
MSGHRVGRKLLLSVAFLTAVGDFAADWNRTHLVNPWWTTHAKFHDAMTILLGLMLGVGALYLLRNRDGGPLLQLRWGTLLPAFFWAAQAGAFQFPPKQRSEFNWMDHLWRPLKQQYPRWRSTLTPPSRAYCAFRPGRTPQSRLPRRGLLAARLVREPLATP